VAHPRNAKALSRTIVLTGLLIALLCAFASVLGWFDPLERASLDARFQHAQSHERNLSNDIRLIEIDDGAIESVGRWPWPRSTLADALKELSRAGAKTVALDLLLDDPSEPEWLSLESDPSIIELVDHDAALARVLAITNSVLAVDAPFDLDDFERGVLKEHSAAAEAAVARFRADITHRDDGGDEYLIPEDISSRRLQALAALAVAIERRSRLAPDEPDDLHALLRALAPDIDEDVGDFPERRLVERASEHARAHSIVSSILSLELPAEIAVAEALMLERIEPPTPTLAFPASSFGFVNFDADPDGSPRTMPPRKATPLGELPQFGLAAACSFLGVNPSEVRITQSAIDIDGRSVPMRDGKLLVSWPSPTAFRASSDEQRMSLGAPVSIARNRAILDRLAANRVTLAAAINNIDAESVDDDSLAAARELTVLRLAELDELIDAGEEITFEEREYLLPFERFAQVERAIDSGRIEIANAEAELRRRVEGKLCFVGWSASGALADFVPTPLGDRTPGVVVHAAIADSMITGRAKVLAPDWTVPALTFALALVGTLIVAALPTAASFAVFVLIGVGYIGLAGFGAFRFSELAMPLAGPVVGLTVSWAICTALDAAASRVERARIQRQFKSRVAPQLVERLAADPHALAVEGEAREITVIFLDVAGFTTISEQLDGPQTVALINDCMRAFTAALTKADAYVNKFLGDGLMAFWSAFDIDPDQADKAVGAAVACLEAIETVNAKRVAIDPAAKPLAVRVGVATGVAIVGDCGAPPDLNDYTAIGNAVNLASRLEGACKAFGIRAMIDGRTRELMKKPPPSPLRRLGRVVVVGQSVPVEVFEIPRIAHDERRLTRWAEALDCFERADFEACLGSLTQYAGEFGEEPSCDRLREVIEDMREHAEAPQVPVAIKLRSK
jgi:CHASE2 domain-containing sensor protein/class 3 adenylate cyclase